MSETHVTDSRAIVTLILPREFRDAARSIHERLEEWA